jgi:hypothetical protein
MASRAKLVALAFGSLAVGRVEIQADLDRPDRRSGAAHATPPAGGGIADPRAQGRIRAPSSWHADPSPHACIGHPAGTGRVPIRGRSTSDPSDPADPPDPPDEAASSAAVDPADEPEPADIDPPEDPEAADGAPPM